MNGDDEDATISDSVAGATDYSTTIAVTNNSLESYLFKCVGRLESKWQF